MFLPRSKKSWLGTAVVGAALVSGLARAEFKDPLHTPAPANALAASSEFNSLTRAGDRLVAVGRRGLIMVSDDHGKGWRQVQVPTSVDLTAVHFSSPLLGWAVGHGGVVLHSWDGGLSWKTRLAGRQVAELLLSHYQRLAAAGDPEAERVLPDAEIFADDGDVNPFLDVWFESEQVGYLVGAFNLILRTGDGGETWAPWLERTENPGAYHLYDIDGSGGEVYIAGEKGLVLRLDREAGRFVAVPTPYQGSFFGVVAARGSVVVYGLRGHAYSSQDRGQSWSPVATGGRDSVTGSTLLADGRMALVTLAGGLLISDDGGRNFVRKQASRPRLSDIEHGGGELVTVGHSGVSIEPLQK